MRDALSISKQLPAYFDHGVFKSLVVIFWSSTVGLFN